VALCGVLLRPRWWPGYACAGVCGFLLILAGGSSQSTRDWAEILGLRPPRSPVMIYQAETLRGLVRVDQTELDRAHVLRVDGVARAGAKPLNAEWLGDEGARMFAAVTDRVARPDTDSRAVMLGDGAFAFAQYFLQRWPRGRIEVVEVDPGLIPAARLC